MDEERLMRFQYEEENPCNGNSTHKCIECGKSFSCYACPDKVNLIYSQTTCLSCLDKLLNGELEEGGDEMR